MADFGFSGDPKIYIDADGADLTFRGGQPDMDIGVENKVLIGLFTRQGWVGNDLFDQQEEHIGADFEAAAEQPVTLSALNDIRDAALKALADRSYGDVDVSVENPTGTTLQVTISLPGGQLTRLMISDNGIVWNNQINK